MSAIFIAGFGIYDSKSTRNPHFLQLGVSSGIAIFNTKE